MHRTILMRAAGALLCLTLLALTICTGIHTAWAAEGGSSAVADDPTTDAYQDILGTETLSTRFAGRVWNDKSVTTNASVTFGDGTGQTHTFSKSQTNGAVDPNSFLITYSALATSQSVTGGRPADVVFVLDLSASMCWGTKDTKVTSEDDSRIKAAVDALNASIEQLVQNDSNRIGIAVFNGDAEVLLKLTNAKDIKKYADGKPYVELTSFVPKANNPDEATATVTLHMAKEDVTATTAGGTNIQAGLYQGMKLLANEENTTDNSNGVAVVREPNVIVMSDGAPTTFASARYSQYRVGDGSWQDRDSAVTSDTSIEGKDDEGVTFKSGPWWNLELTNDGTVSSRSTIGAIGGGDNYRAHSADGFMALATASFMKNKISENYYGTSSGKQDTTAKVYTIGFSTSYQTDSMARLASVVLNPSDNLTSDLASLNTGSPCDQEFKTLWNAYQEYLKGNDATVYGHIGDKGNNKDVTGSSDTGKFDWDDMQLRAYSVEHPEGADKAYDPTSFVYPTAYYEASDSQGLVNAFEQIAGLITESAKAPTKVTAGDLAHSGYITYTDPIGTYLEVRSVRGLLFGSTMFDVVKEVQNGDGSVTYRLSTADGATTVDTPLYSNESINDIIITLATDEQGAQALTVKIPASMIPLRINAVTLASDGASAQEHTTNGVLPLRLVYEVGVADGVLDARGNLIEGTGAYRDGAFDGVSSDYVADHTLADGTVALYTNAYTGATQGEGEERYTVGEANVSFTPARDNPFFFIQEDAPLYSSRTAGVVGSGGAVGERATGMFDPAKTYYFAIEYFTGNTIERCVIERSGALLQDYVGTDDEGLYYRKGAPCLGNLLEVVDASKADSANKTGTAEASYYPVFEGKPEAGNIRVYLGNNGRLALAVAAGVAPALRVLKIEAGHDDAAAAPKLGGAGFALYADTNGNGSYDAGEDQPLKAGADGTAEVVRTAAKGDEAGMAAFLPDGYRLAIDTTYFLVEAEAPPGYQLMSGAVSVTFEANDGTDAAHGVDEFPLYATVAFPGGASERVWCSAVEQVGTGDAAHMVAPVQITVADQPLPALPVTGGIGRTAAVVGGMIALSVGACAWWRIRTGARRS